MKAVFRFVLLSAVAIIAMSNASAQSKMDSIANRELYVEIARMDSLLFTAFNNRDLETIKKIFSTDLEFYHDKGGLTNYVQNIENSKKLFDQNNGLRRDLVAGSMEVYPIKDYGAVQIAKHRFCHPENGKMDCGTFKFVHVWKKTEGVWKLTRVVSYDH